MESVSALVLPLNIYNNDTPHVLGFVLHNIKNKMWVWYAWVMSCGKTKETMWQMWQLYDSYGDRGSWSHHNDDYMLLNDKKKLLRWL